MLVLAGLSSWTVESSEYSLSLVFTHIVVLNVCFLWRTNLAIDQVLNPVLMLHTVSVVLEY